MAIAVYGQSDSAGGPKRALSIGGVFNVGPSLEYGIVYVPEIRDCDSLASGTALSLHASVLVERPIARALSLQLRLGAYFDRGELRQRASTALALPSESGELVDGLYDHVLTFDRTTIAGSLVARYDATDRLELAAGLEASRNASNQTFRQEAISPSSLLFRGQRVVDVRSGVIVPTAPFTISALASIGYRLPLSARSWLVPEASLQMPITSMADESAWRRARIAFGASLRVDLFESVAAPPAVDTPIVIAPPSLAVTIATRPSIVEVQVDEYDSTEALPLLNQVFFTEGTSSLPSRYNALDDSSAARFTLARLVGSALDVYYDLLNVVGWRMKRSPDATLAIDGYRNGREQGSALSRQRAEEIRNYLTRTWGIAESRITARGRALPKNPARETLEEGFEENARAHLEPSDPNITAPVIRVHIQRVATPPSIVFYPRADAEAPVRSWRLDVVQDSVLWRRFEGLGEPPDSIEWDWRSNRNDLPEIPMQLGYELAVTDTTGQVATTPRRAVLVQYHSKSQRLEHRQNDTLIQSYSLLLFNYDSPNVSAEDQELLRAIASQIDARARVRVTGYTDSLGLESHNRELALRRATETARLLGELVPAGTSITVNPEGGERERFPFNTPEGRSHCRTVVIDVRTPAKENP